MSSGEMAILLPRRPPHEDVTKIPTPPLQAAGLFINFFFPALALVIVSLRFYSRISMRQWGAGKSVKRLEYCWRSSMRAIAKFDSLGFV